MAKYFPSDGAAATQIAIGETVVGGTADSILFVDNSGLIGQDNPAFTYDETGQVMDINSSATTDDVLTITNNSGTTGSGLKIVNTSPYTADQGYHIKLVSGVNESQISAENNKIIIDTDGDIRFRTSTVERVTIDTAVEISSNVSNGLILDTNGGAGDDSIKLRMQSTTSAAEREVKLYNEADALTDTYRFAVDNNADTRLFSVDESGLGFFPFALDVGNKSTSSGTQVPSISLFNNGGGASEYAGIHFYNQDKASHYWSVEVDPIHSWGPNTWSIRNEGAGANAAWNHDLWTDNWLAGGQSVGFLAYDDTAGAAWGFQFSETRAPADGGTGLWSFFVSSFIGVDWDESFNQYLRPSSTVDHNRLGVGVEATTETPPYLLTVSSESANNPPVIGIRDNTASDNLDPIVSYYHQTTHKWTHGVDRSDSDKFKISVNADLSSPLITLESTTMTLASPATTQDLFVIDGSTVTTGDIININAANALTTGNVLFIDANSTGAGAAVIDAFVESAPTSTAQTFYEFDAETDGSGTQTQDIIGLQATMKMNNPGVQSTNTGMGAYVDYRHNSTGAAADLIGARIRCSCSTISGSTITLMRGVHAFLEFDGQRTLTDGYALHAEYEAGGSTGTSADPRCIYTSFADQTAGSHTFTQFTAIETEAMSIVSTNGSTAVKIGAITDTGTENVGIDIANVSGATTNYALKTGNGVVSLGGGYVINTTAVSSSPYTALVNDHVILVDTTSIAITINLPASASTDDGTVYVIKDEASNASGNNITVSANGSDTIDGSGSITMSTNNISRTLILRGTRWSVI